MQSISGYVPYSCIGKQFFYKSQRFFRPRTFQWTIAVQCLHDVRDSETQCVDRPYDSGISGRLELSGDIKCVLLLFGGGKSEHLTLSDDTRWLFPVEELDLRSTPSSSDRLGLVFRISAYDLVVLSTFFSSFYALPNCFMRLVIDEESEAQLVFIWKQSFR